MARLPARITLVTGGARGIGLAIATRLAVDGARVVLVDRDADRVGEAADRIGATAFVADLSDPDAVPAVVARVATEVGPVEVLVNNAGIFAKTAIVDTTAACWDAVFAVNTRAVFLTTQAVAPAMIERGWGRIVNIASMAAKLGTPGEAAYAASKAAVVAFTRITAMELGAHGITANAICPGYVLTEMGAATRTPEMVAGWTAKSPLGRLTAPEDVASMAAFLASDDAADLTGQALNVASGMVMS